MSDEITDLQRRAVEARNKDEVLDFGTTPVLLSGESLYGLLPARAADWLDVERGTTLRIGVDLESRSFVLTVVDDEDDVDVEQTAEA